MSYCIYMLECSNGAYYTGYTTDIERRYQEHLQGSSKCKYTRSFPPKKIAACWELDLTLSEILSMERKIKNLNRQQKRQLVANPQLLTSLIEGHDSAKS